MELENKSELSLGLLVFDESSFFSPGWTSLVFSHLSLCYGFQSIHDPRPGVLDVAPKKV